MNNDVEQDGTPEDAIVEESAVSEQDLSTLSEEDLNEIIEGTPDEANAQEPTQPESQKQEESVEPHAEDKPPMQPEEIEKLKAQVEEQRKFNERRSTELGQLRAKLREEKTKYEELVKQLELDSPVEAVRAERQVERLKEQEEALEAEDYKLAAESRFLSTVPKHVKPEEFNVEAMREELLADGVRPEGIDNFMSTLSQQDPGLVINMAKRAYYASALKKLVPLTQALLAERDQWSKKSESQGERIARSISQELKKPKQLVSGRPTQRTVSAENVNPAAWSDAELEEILLKG